MVTSFPFQGNNFAEAVEIQCKRDVVFLGKDINFLFATEASLVRASHESGDLNKALIL